MRKGAVKMPDPTTILVECQNGDNVVMPKEFAKTGSTIFYEERIEGEEYTDKLGKKHKYKKTHFAFVGDDDITRLQRINGVKTDDLE